MAGGPGTIEKENEVPAMRAEPLKTAAKPS